MKSIKFSAYGEPDAIHLTNAPEPSVGVDDVLVQLEAAPLNPSDFMVSDGHYPLRPPLPAPMGSEGVGRIAAVGAGVSDLVVGSRVLVIPGDEPRTWQERFVVHRSEVVVVDGEVDAVQLATVGINAATAYLVLETVELEPGAWVAITAANSDVAASVYALAARKGVRTVGLVRSERSGAAATAAGADHVVVTGDGVDVVAEVKAVLGDDKLALVLDGVGGAPAEELAPLMAREAHLVSYSALSGKPIAVHPMYLNFSNLHVDGFWLNNWLTSTPRSEVVRVYTELAALAAAGVLPTRVDSTYPLDEVDAAVGRARSGGRDGKVFFVVNGGAVA
ncbi:MULTISPECIES: alcohol dehydrogenase catalytic domain-containing protein [unclassified Curtobacterium]|uniref:alcohol dehydrogenase catalytic domain-containing protein n=1 Tax=unclassified Curtobacterium TaxID=257496 RepID=UPI0015E89239|nr:MULTISPECIES: zinc-binding dehydrogenase [unclassified Curtobacterium]